MKIRRKKMKDNIGQQDGTRERREEGRKKRRTREEMR